jgi:hypothetical protein
VTVLAVVLLMGLVAPAGAHSIAPGVRNLVDNVAPRIPGVTVLDRFTAADELDVTNTTTTPLEVLAPTGEPFLRISRSAVEANTNSVAWYASESLAYNAISSVPGVDPSLPPAWITVASIGRWSWFDPRLRPDLPADVVGAGVGRGPIRLGSWAIALRYGREVATISGHREYRAVQGSYNQQLLSAANPFPGLRVAVVGGTGPTPAAYIDNEGSQTVTVIGAGGEPLLRIGPSGVDANLASPSWRLTAAARQEAPTGLVSSALAPRWEHVTSEHQFSWLEERGDAPGIDPPAGAGARGPTFPVRRWTFPMAEGARRALVAAEVVWLPLTPGSSAGGRAGPSTVLLVAGGAVGGALVAGAALAWSRRRAAGGTIAGPT